MEFMPVLFKVFSFVFQSSNYLGHITTRYNGKISRYFSYYSNVLHLLLMQIDDHDFNYSDLLLYERMSSI